MVLSKPKPRLGSFDSNDGQYNWLGLDDGEFKKYMGRENDDQEMDSQEEVHIQSHPYVMGKYYDYKQTEHLNVYGPELANRFPYLRQKTETSEDFVAVNDSENEYIVPQGVEVQEFANSNDFED